MALDGSRAAYYRQRAREAREKAETCQDLETKIEFQTAAAYWEALAKQVEWGLLRP